jgi:hypothetical protein
MFFCGCCFLPYTIYERTLFIRITFIIHVTFFLETLLFFTYFFTCTHNTTTTTYICTHTHDIFLKHHIYDRQTDHHHAYYYYYYYYYYEILLTDFSSLTPPHTHTHTADRKRTYMCIYFKHHTYTHNRHTDIYIYSHISHTHI